MAPVYKGQRPGTCPLMRGSTVQGTNQPVPAGDIGGGGGSIELTG